MMARFFLEPGCPWRPRGGGIERRHFCYQVGHLAEMPTCRYQLPPAFVLLKPGGCYMLHVVPPPGLHTARPSANAAITLGRHDPAVLLGNLGTITAAQLRQSVSVSDFLWDAYSQSDRHRAPYRKKLRRPCTQEKC